MKFLSCFRREKFGSGCRRRGFISLYSDHRKLAILHCSEPQHLQRQCKQRQQHSVFENLVWSLVFAIAIIGISSLGISAASSENICGLITFAGFMGAGMIITLISGFYVVTNKKGYSENISLYFNSFEIAIGICFGFSILALLGLLISLFMIHQIKHHDRSPGEYSMAMNIVQTEASGPLTSALLQEEPAVKA
ncbi:uncharacterized protein LOC124999950 isoform X2 [Mugil cephalus]|uniref:uncharacterized protein LOC124999950 isoform X2 n=1 Tax=Mugil cephalus TaxID=48193 RepID=UPI001FB6F852|nr:uncharacterized protein LOC124999950 isoform X2 [Mugil cephalus]